MRLSTRDADEVVQCWKETMNTNPFITAYNTHRQALVLSFDDDLKPFLNYTKGYHHPKAKRPYLKTVPRVIRHLGELVYPFRGTGGRVFINREKAYYVDESSISTDLCELSWPKDRDVINEVRRFSKRRTIITLRGVRWDSRTGGTDTVSDLN